MVSRTNLHSKRCWNLFSYLNPKHSLTESYENQTVRHLRICHVHNCQTPKPLIACIWHTDAKEKNLELCQMLKSRTYTTTWKWYYDYRIALLDTTKTHIMSISRHTYCNSVHHSQQLCPCNLWGHLCVWYQSYWLVIGAKTAKVTSFFHSYQWRWGCESLSLYCPP